MSTELGNEFQEEMEFEVLLPFIKMTQQIQKGAVRAWRYLQETPDDFFTSEDDEAIQLVEALAIRLGVRTLNRCQRLKGQEVDEKEILEDANLAILKYMESVRLSVLRDLDQTGINQE